MHSFHLKLKLHVKCYCEEEVNDLTFAKERSCHCEEESDEAIQKSINTIG